MNVNLHYDRNGTTSRTHALTSLFIRYALGYIAVADLNTGLESLHVRGGFTAPALFSGYDYDQQSWLTLTIQE